MKDITPYQIRYKLLELAEKIVSTNSFKKDSDIEFKKQIYMDNYKSNDKLEDPNDLKLDQYNVDDVIVVAKKLRNFVDNK